MNNTERTLSRILRVMGGEAFYRNWAIIYMAVLRLKEKRDDINFQAKDQATP